MPPAKAAPDPNKLTKSDLQLKHRAEVTLEARKLAKDYAAYFRAAWAATKPDEPLTESWHYDYIAEWLGCPRCSAQWGTEPAVPYEKWHIKGIEEVAMAEQAKEDEKAAEKESKELGIVR